MTTISDRAELCVITCRDCGKPFALPFGAVTMQICHACHIAALARFWAEWNA